MQDTTSLLQPLLSFKEQYRVPLEIKNSEKLIACESAIICGMGGSLISARLLSLLFPSLPISTHNSYGLPKIKNGELVIINSYSGNTEESLDAFDKAVTISAPTAVISTGGKLIELAKLHGIPYIQLPESSLEPRFAIGIQMVAMVTLLQRKDILGLLEKAVEEVHLERTLEIAGELAKRCAHKYPVLYSSSILSPLTYPIKAAINEGAKLPAFCNIIPEANHNELQGFIVDEERNERLSFAFLFFVSPFDHPRIQKRMASMQKLYQSYGFVCEEIVVDHSSRSMVLEALFLGYAFATHLALERGVDPYSTPFIAEFKKDITL